MKTLENGSKAIANFKQNGPPKLKRAKSSITDGYRSGSYAESGSEESRSSEDEDEEEEDIPDRLSAEDAYLFPIVCWRRHLKCIGF